jgi:hypothetical protein
MGYEFGTYYPGANVHCPHCGQGVCLKNPEVRTTYYNGAVNEDGRTREVSPRGSAYPAVNFSQCPLCQKVIVQLVRNQGSPPVLVHPKTGSRRPVHKAVPVELVKDYGEAVVVLNDSPKASAALSRRCLQALLLKQGAKKRNLAEQLDELHDTLPGYCQSFVDNIRKLGNIAAHPKQDPTTAEILDVEPGEAEWMLELLEELFDHYYAKPAEAKARQDALSKKFAPSTS